jgi:type IV secretory pathway protease TraF
LADLDAELEQFPVDAGAPHGRPLPVWQGCRRVAEGEIFLMNWDEPASLDGRYFGSIPLSTIVGRAEPLWTYEEE